MNSAEIGLSVKRKSLLLSYLGTFYFKFSSRWPGRIANKIKKGCEIIYPVAIYYNRYHSVVIQEVKLNIILATVTDGTVFFYP